MSKQSEQRAALLGMSHGAANNQLRKAILFRYVQRAGDDNCFRCGRQIESVADLSIEHKQPWENRSAELFFNLDNIAFSHLSCNSAHGRIGTTSTIGQWAKDNITKVGPPESAWCTGCQDFHNRAEFTLNKSGRDGLQTECREYRSKQRSKMEASPNGMAAPC